MTTDGTTYHCALSVDIDRFSDAKLRRYIRGILLDEKPATVAGMRAACADYRERGHDVFPPCDNTDERGNCKGHK